MLVALALAALLVAAIVFAPFEASVGYGKHCGHLCGPFSGTSLTCFWIDMDWPITSADDLQELRQPHPGRLPVELDDEVAKDNIWDLSGSKLDRFLTEICDLGRRRGQRSKVFNSVSQPDADDFELRSRDRDSRQVHRFDWKPAYQPMTSTSSTYRATVAVNPFGR